MGRPQPSLRVTQDGNGRKSQLCNQPTIVIVRKRKGRRQRGKEGVALRYNLGFHIRCSGGRIWPVLFYHHGGRCKVSVNCSQVVNSHVYQVVPACTLVQVSSFASCRPHGRGHSQGAEMECLQLLQWRWRRRRGRWLWHWSTRLMLQQPGLSS